jgi:large subunit ribosomal protein L28
VSAKCDVCGKGPVFGRNIRYNHGGQWERRAPKTSRRFEPNLHNATIYVNGAARRVRICTRCLRSQYKTA